MIEREDASHAAEMYFIIRLDPVGSPIKLEYAPAHGGASNVEVITR